MLGCVLGVLLVSVTQNGLNLLGVSPYAFKMIVGAIILFAITPVERAVQPACSVAQSAAECGMIETYTANCATSSACRLLQVLGPETRALLALVVVSPLVAHAPLPDRCETFGSIAFQLPELGLLTLAMLVPILSGGLNLAITYTANFCGLTLAWVLQAHGGHGRRLRRLHPRLASRRFAVGAAAA